MAGIRSEYRSQNKSDINNINLPPHWTWQPTRHWRFTGLDEILSVASRPTSAWTSARVSRALDPTLGTATWDEALRLARYGWAEGCGYLVRETGAYAHQFASPAKGWQYDYAGAFPDVPRFLGGDLDCMIGDYPESLRFQQIVRMVVSPITHIDVTNVAIKNWGAALVSWIDELERAGQRVEVTWLSCSCPYWVYPAEQLQGQGGPTVAISFCLKEADQPVDLDRLAFWIMHPAAQRRIQFAIKEQMDIEKWYYENLGQPIFDIKFMRNVFGKDAMIFSVERGAETIELGLISMKRHAEEFKKLINEKTIAV